MSDEIVETEDEDDYTDFCDICEKAPECRDRENWIREEQKWMCEDGGCTSWEDDEFFIYGGGRHGELK
jgi:hypothetical protein